MVVQQHTHRIHPLPSPSDDTPLPTGTAPLRAFWFPSLIY